MIQFLKTAITRGPDPLRTQPASFCTVWPRKTLSTPRVELVTALPTRAGPIATKSYDSGCPRCRDGDGRHARPGHQWAEKLAPQLV